MNHLQKLAAAIRNSNDFLKAVSENSQTSRKSKKTNYTSSKDTSPTSEEKDKHEAGISYDSPLDLSVEPAVEYLR
jgi:hypothetical protein